MCPWGLLAWRGIAGGLVLWRMFLFVISFVTVGRWVIGRPLNGSRWSLLKLFLWYFLGFLVLVLPSVHSAHWQQGRGLRVLRMNCSLHEFEFRLCLRVVLGWFSRFADRVCVRLAELWLRPVASCCTFDHGWVVCPSHLVFVPIGLYSVYGFCLMRCPCP